MINTRKYIRVPLNIVTTIQILTKNSYEAIVIMVKLYLYNYTNLTDSLHFETKYYS